MKVIAAIGIAIYLFAKCTGSGGDSGGGNYASACPSIPAGALWLPADRQQFMAELERHAWMLNKRGQCVQSGSWGEASQSYYLTVQEVGAPTPRNVYITQAELVR